MPMHIYDHRESEIPKLGMIKMKDPETGKEFWADTSSRKLRENYRNHWQNRIDELEEILMKNKVDKVRIRTDESYIAPLKAFFKMRGKRK